MNTEDRIIDEAKAKVRRELEEDEARWIARKLGWAVACYPRIIAETLRAAIGPELGMMHFDLEELVKRLNAIDMQIQAINERLNKAGQLVKAIDERTRPKAAQPRR